MARHVEALHGTLSAHAPLTIVGHSFGAVAAVAYAAAHPDLVERFILIGMPAFASEDQAKEHFRQRRRPDRWLHTNMAIASLTCLLTRRLIRPILRRLSRDLPRDVADDLVLHTWRSSTSTLWEGIYRHDVVDDVARLPSDLPILLLHGDRDETAPLSAIPRVMAAHPRTALRVLRGVDHHPVLRQPGLVNMEIAEFVRRTSRIHLSASAWPAGAIKAQRARAPVRAWSLVRLTSAVGFCGPVQGAQLDVRDPADLQRELQWLVSHREDETRAGVMALQGVGHRRRDDFAIHYQTDSALQVDGRQLHGVRVRGHQDDEFVTRPAGGHKQHDFAGTLLRLVHRVVHGCRCRRPKGWCSTVAAVLRTNGQADRQGEQEWNERGSHRGCDLVSWVAPVRRDADAD